MACDRLLARDIGVRATIDIDWTGTRCASSASRWLFSHPHPLSGPARCEIRRPLRKPKARRAGEDAFLPAQTDWALWNAATS
jgi:hypothetical protein